MKNDLFQYPVIIEQNVTWGDMDAHGHVNNVEYFRYMENARVEYYTRIDKYEFEARTGITLVLKSTGCKYISPLAYPDTISIGARVKEIKDDHILMVYLVVNVLRKRIAAVGEAIIVALKSSDNTRVPIPGELKKRILDLQQEMVQSAEEQEPSGSKT